MSFLDKILHLLNLDRDMDDFDVIHATITKDVVFKGTNLWILVFAIVVASVGLNMNSTAVIIGAMLISPLMGPINGMGYSIATYNFLLFRVAVKNYSFAVIAALLASTAYFAISPVSAAHSELLARTSPTIYDVMIALFGGLAGIVAISSRHKGNVIPGVAIATALMPPLCTAGYGLATAQFEFFFGALYLFTINRWITAVIIITASPSVYLGYRLVKDEQFNESATRFIQQVSLFEGNYLLRSEVLPKQRSISLIYGGTTFDSLQKAMIVRRAGDFGLADAGIEVKQGLSFAELPSEVTEKERYKSEINRLSLLLLEMDRQRDSLDARLSFGKILLAEIQALEPRITACAYSEGRAFAPGHDTSRLTSIVVFSIKSPMKDRDRAKVDTWLRSRLGNDNVISYYDREAGLDSLLSREDANRQALLSVGTSTGKKPTTRPAQR